MVPRYTALPIIAIILKILSYVVLVVTLLSSAYLLVVGSMPRLPVDTYDTVLNPQMISTTQGLLGSSFLHTHLIPAFTTLLAGSLMTLFIMAFAHGIHVLLDIEENTRRTADLATGETSQPTPLRTER